MDAATELALAPTHAPLPFAAELRRLDESDLGRVIALHRCAVEALADPSLAAMESDEFFARHIDATGRIYGVLSKGELIAYAVLGFPVDAGYNFGVQLGLEGADLRRVAHIDGVAVREDYRGHRLQLRLCLFRIARAMQAGRPHICSTVAPLNHASVWSTFAAGMRIEAIARMFGGHLRYVMHRLANGEPEFATGDETVVALTDFARQRALLAAGQVGWRRTHAGDGYLIHFARPLRTEP